MAADPIHQFQINKLFTLGHIGGQEIAFTNSSAYMFAAVAVISLLMLGTGRQLIPGRMQSIAEISYEFVASTIRSTAGSEGMKFFPLIFSLSSPASISPMLFIRATDPAHYQTSRRSSFHGSDCRKVHWRWYCLHWHGWRWRRRGHHFLQLPRRCGAQSLRGPGPVRQPDF